MNAVASRNYLAGLAIYAACIGLAVLPIFPDPLTAMAAMQLVSAAAVASALVGTLRMSGVARQLNDPGAIFIQAALGIGICGGLYSLVSTQTRPEVLFMAFLLWSAVGLMHLTPARVAALFALNLAVYLSVLSRYLLRSVGDELYAETMFMLLASALMAGFMTWRARDYTRVRHEKSRLMDENVHKTEKLEEAEARIHALTVQDMDTIALKYPYFKDALVREKTRADQIGGTFSIGLLEIDHFADIAATHGEVVAKQLLREFAERATSLIKKMGFMDMDDDNYRPLGRVGEGLFGLILPTVNLKGAQHCAERLHHGMEFRDIKTSAGPLTITLAIGVTEYARGEDVDALMAELSVSLERARLDHDDIYNQIYKKDLRPKQSGTPIKAASSAKDMQLLDYKDYHRPVH
ncbi:MAG: GGDEF domain-containing protein [Gammaproteobacteria bacterium]